MSSILTDLRNGIESYSAAWRIMRDRKLWVYMVIPGFLSLLFGTFIFFSAYKASGSARDIVASWYPWENAREIVAAIAGVMGAILVAAIGLIIYKYVILILVAPFMSVLSETVENYLTGKTESVSFSLKRAVREMLRGVRIALRNIIRELVLTFVLFILGFVPVIGLMSGPAIFILQAYYAGFGNMDFTMERHLGVKQSVRFVSAYKGLAIGNGMIFLLILMIPVVGLFVAPGLATVAGAIETLDRLERSAQYSV